MSKKKRNDRLHTVNAIRYRARQAEIRLDQAVKIVREEAAAGNYRGPALTEVEAVARSVSDLHAALRLWWIDEVAR